jgi:hypothetical protein
MFRRTLLDAHKPRNSSYTDVQICEEWHNFQNFAEWMSSQVILDSSWHLDKDLLVKGSKIYSPETCVFLPPEVNMFFTKRKSKRGDYPIGVSYRETTSRFLAGMTWEGKNVYLGSFSSPEEAFCAYKARKEQCAKELAEKWHDKIDARAYEALLNYTVEITD